MTYTVGSLVRVRGREWVVLPESTDDLVRVRPLGGTEDEVTAVLTALEPIEPATFALPDPEQIGDYRSARLLRAAVRLGFRASAGPFRSFAKINVEPRPYQLVPLLMALKQDPVRLLIADDVGIGKTVEALLVARELLDRGEIDRLAVLCPPQLAEQWHAELREKFYVEAELLLASTATRLERHLRMGESIFDRYPFTVVSTDFIKSERRRDDFLRAAPDFIIVDEAHTVAHTTDRRGGRHQRYELVAALADKPERHLVLVTATPHSGKEAAFRSLLALLNSDFDELPDDLTGAENEPLRRELARYFVQRRRGDIKAYMDAITPFPEREAAEDTYTLSDAYKRLFDRVLNYARETVLQPGEGCRQRVRWWSALALLRSLASSPAAAAATLRSRAATAEAETSEDVDEIGRRTVFDLMTDEAAEGVDVVPGSQLGELADNEKRHRERLLDMARTAEALQGDDDRKLQGVIDIVKQLLRDGYNPIVFCRFIPTVDYLTEALRDATRGVEIAGVTGTLPPAEREERVSQLATHDKRVLVCTDCLSEGINLQQGFDAVVHYDLSWNPTRHEQREGRVDRYGQPNDRIKVVTYYGIDNQIDGIVLDVLLRKHKTIRNSLGVSVPVPGNSEDVVEAIFEGLLLRENASFSQTTLPGFDEYMKPGQMQLDLQWEAAAEREKQSRTMFAQQAIKVDEVAAELNAARDAVGSGVDVAAFMRDAVRMHRGVVSVNGAVGFDLTETPRGLRDMLGEEQFTARFELPVKNDQLYLTRTHPLVESLATYVMNTALDAVEVEEDQPRARRAGAIRTTAVERRTTLLLVRFRYHLITKTRVEERQLLAEDSLTLAFEGSPENAQWLDPEASEALLQAEPEENIHPQQAADFVGRVVAGFDDHLAPTLNDIARERGGELLAAHLRVREAAYRRGDRRPQHRVEAQLPPDVLGIYVYLPVRR
ncbi:DEAD/DEAH box helicase [Phototrophicus methaneseepsis]|uniref:DEAD/DEAH box helicase n=1 Tax=Phototrophicus methaneseepsis TaxID=2710758 RepID=A0A7S8EB18_9CHLR|nr:helicase-related protein [Phototrophicus methaneseepsis]QPC83627.1 DEAD/DEAH box helicase [Phototrophicus methaneseepsis]